MNISNGERCIIFLIKSWKLFEISFKETKSKIFYFMFACLTVLAAQSIFNMFISLLEKVLSVPIFLSTFFAHFFWALLSLGVFVFCIGWHKKQKLEIKDLFIFFHRKESFLKIFPYAFWVSILAAVLAFAEFHVHTLSSYNYISVIFLFINLLLSICLYYTGVIFYNEGLRLIEAFRKTISKFFKNINIIAGLIFFILLISLIVVSPKLLQSFFLQNPEIGKSLGPVISMSLLIIDSCLAFFLLLILIPILFYLPYVLYRKILVEEVF